MNLHLAASSDPRLLPAVWKLLRLRLRINWNSFRHAKTSRKVLTILAAVGLALFAGSILLVSWLLLGFLRSPQLAAQVGDQVAAVLSSVPVLILTALFLGILLTSFGVLLQALYLSGDMEFLLAAPVPIRAVFTAKLLQAVLPNLGLIALFGIPILFGLGLAGNYSPLYYPLVLLVMAALALAAAGISGVLVMLAARLFPPRRVAEVLGFVTAILMFTCSQSGNLFNTFGRDVNISGQQMNGFFTLLLRSNTPWLPLNWAGQGLVAVGEGRWLPGLLLTGLTLGACLLVFLTTLATAEGWYYRGWARMQVVATQKRIHGRQPAGEQELSQRSVLPTWLLPAPVLAIVRKDFLVLRRDLRNLSQLLSPLIFGVMYSLMFFRLGGEPPAGMGEAPAEFMSALRNFLTYGSIGMSLFVGWTLLSRLAGMAFSSEGRNYWILKAAPLPVRQLLTAKYLVAYLPALVLGLVFVTAFSLLQKLSWVDIVFSLYATALCLAGMNGILLGFGAAGANLTWEDPRKMGAGSLGCLGQFLTMLFLPFSFGFFTVPLILFPLLQLPPVLGYLTGLVLGSALAMVAAILPPRLARGKVERLGEA